MDAPTPITAADEILARGRFTHTTKAGTTYGLRALSVLSLVERGIVPPALVDGTKQEKDAAAAEINASMESRLALIRGVVCAAIVSLRVWPGDPFDCPPGHVLYEDLGDDPLELFPAIMDKSGFSVEVVRAARFPDGEPGAGDAGGPGGGAQAGVDPVDAPDVAGGVGA